MSLRETFLTAQKDGYADLIAMDWKTVSDTLAEFSAKIPAVVKDVTAIARTGAVPNDKQKEGRCRGFALGTLPLDKVDQKALEALPGYRRLHNFCRSSDTDISLTITALAGPRDRFNNYLAYIRLTIDPAIGFQASELITYASGDYSKTVKTSIAKALPANGDEKMPPTSFTL